nr:response regulator [Pseudorhodoferax sp. Leaf267]
MQSEMGEAAALSTMEVARRLGLAVRSVQLMVDRGELLAWKTPGGHRRISHASVKAWEFKRDSGLEEAPASAASPGDAGPDGLSAKASAARPGPAPQRVLLIEDSVHYQRLMSLLLQDAFADVELHVASDGITGLTMYGQLQPDVLIVDILLPGIDGPTLISTLRSQPQFAHTRIIVVTSLDQDERLPYAHALVGVPVVHKPRLAADLPALLAQALAGADRARGG